MRASDRVVRRLVDAGVEGDELRTLALRIAEEEAPLASSGVADAAVASLVGLGPLDPLMADPGVTDVLVNGPDEVWVERGGRLHRCETSFPDAGAVVQMVRRALVPVGVRFDRGSPMVSARLVDGSRLHAVMPPAVVGSPVVAIRRFVPVVYRLDDLVRLASATEAVAATLRGLVRDRANIVVSGGTGAGKTTLLNVLAAEVPADQRIVSVEEAAELRLPGHVVRLEARPPNSEGQGEITVEALVKTALRLRPDRLVVGEVRGGEALDLIQAMSTGHDGSLGTVHANGPAEAMWRLETLALRAPGARSVEAVRRQLWDAVNAVVHTERSSGHRRIAAVHRVVDGRTEPLC